MMALMTRKDVNIPHDRVIKDPELENINGDLIIAQYQVNKLRILLGDVFGITMDKEEKSTHVFEYNHKLYKVSVSIDKIKWWSWPTEYVKSKESCRDDTMVY